MLSRLLLQRSLPSLLTIAACSGLRPAPDCRPRGANPHLLDSSTSPFFGDVFVTHRLCSTLTPSGSTPKTQPQGTDFPESPVMRQRGVGARLKCHPCASLK